jgi:hypothetical protein
VSKKIHAARIGALLALGLLAIALAPPNSRAAGGYAYDPCVKLTAALVQPFFTAPVKLRQKDEPKSNSSAECFFDTPDGESEFQVYTATGDLADAFYNENLKQDGVPSVPVSGVGDKAVREPHDIWIYARKGHVFCMIHGDLHTRSQVRGLQKFADKPIPDDLATRYAQQLGTLCNRLFDSGPTTPSFTGLE